MGILIKVVFKKVVNLVDNIEQCAKELIMGSEKIVISSGKNIDREWIRFKKELVEKLNKIDIKKRTENVIINGKMNGLKDVLNQKFSKMFTTLESTMKQKIMNIMGLMAKSELDQISINLRGENFFNLSGNPIDKIVLEQLKYGKKYTPFCALNIWKEKRLFETELSAIVNRIFGKEAANIKTNHLFIKLRKLKKTQLIKNNAELSKILKSIEIECKIGQTNKHSTINHHSVEVKAKTSSKIATMAINVPIGDHCLVWPTVEVQTNDLCHRPTAH